MIETQQMFPERVHRATDPESGLEGDLTLWRGSDGGVAEVGVELRNLSTSADVVLKVEGDLSAFIMLTVADHEGRVLSKPARKYDSSEARDERDVTIARSSSRAWRVPIAAQLSEEAIAEQGTPGRLVVNVALLFAKLRGSEALADEDFTRSILTLHDMDVLFTRAALEEGASR